MTQSEIKELLTKVSKGEKSVDEALLDLRMEPINDMDIANVDDKVEAVISLIETGHTGG